MPIKTTGLPAFFAPTLSDNAKGLLVLQLHFMIRYFTVAHQCGNDSPVYNFISDTRRQLHIDDNYISAVLDQYENISYNKKDILQLLNQELTTTNQRNYCKEIINTMALHISNEVHDKIITQLLNNYIDEYVDIIL